MRDQATTLRSMVLKSLRHTEAVPGQQPRLVLMVGGKGGVGTTTLSVNLAIAMAQHGSRTVLVDADLYRADAAAICGLTENGNVADVIEGRNDIHEVLQLGPGGIQLVPGVWARTPGADPSITSSNRLVHQLKTLGRHADVVLLDAGSRATANMRSLWETADDVLVVTTPDSVAVMDSYATIKAVISPEFTAHLNLIVNKTSNADEAEDVHQRIHQSCQRFLGRSINQLGNVAYDETVRSATDRACPLMIANPQGPIAQQIINISDQFLTRVAEPAAP